MRLLPTPEIRLLTVAQSFSSVGEIAIRIPLVFLLLGLDPAPPSPERVAEIFGSIFFAFMVPSVLFGGLYGWAVDKFDKIKIMVWSDITRICLVATLAILAMANLITPPMVYVLVFLDFTLCGLADPALHSLVPSLVGQNLSRANAALAFSEGAGYTIGPLLGGFFTTYLSGSLEFFVTCCFYAVSAFCSFRLRQYCVCRHGEKSDNLTESCVQIRGDVKKGSEGRTRSNLQKLRNFLFFLKNVLRNYVENLISHKIFVAEIITGLSIGGAATTIPTVLKSGLNVGAAGIGDVWTFSGMGSLAGGILLLTSQALRDFGSIKMIAAIVFLSGIVTIGLGEIKNLLFFGSVLFFLSILFTTRRVFVRNYLQRTLPENFLGRILSSLNMSFYLGYLLGTLILPKFIGVLGLFSALVVIGFFRFIGAGVLLWTERTTGKMC